MKLEEAAAAVVVEVVEGEVGGGKRGKRGWVAMAQFELFIGALLRTRCDH